MTIRPATERDLEEITDIYNDAILRTTATFDTKPKSIKNQLTWFNQHNSNYPLIVADRQEAILGWGALSPWSDRCAYSDTAEISIYVGSDSRGEGVGTRLMEHVLILGKEGGLHTVIGRISSGNETSIRLCERFGFTHIGTMREVGRKFDQLIDVHMMQKML